MQVNNLRIETETARVSVPVEKERVVVERVTPADAGKPGSSGQATFREGEVAHVDIYEETPDIRKEAVGLHGLSIQIGLSGFGLESAFSLMVFG